MPEIFRSAWRSTLAATIEKLGYRPAQADPDVWIKRALKQDGSPYYKLMLIYLDGVLHITEDPEEDMAKLGQEYRLKNCVGPPDRNLGGNIERVQIKDVAVAWSLSCYDYLTNAVRQVEDELSQRNLTLKQFGTDLRPYPACYKPEVDITPYWMKKVPTDFNG